MNIEFKSDFKNMTIYFQIGFKGDMTRNDAYVFTEKTVKLSEEKNVYKYLIDAKQATISGTKQGMVSFVNYDMDLILPRHPYKLAVLISPNSISNLLFLGLLKDNNYNARLFSDEDEAKEWLLED